MKPTAIMRLIVVAVALVSLAACGDGASSSNTNSKSNADLLKEAAANMNTAKSYRLDMDLIQGGVPTKLKGDFDLANDRASYSQSTGEAVSYLITIGKDMYWSVDEGKTYQKTGAAVSFNMWKRVKPEDIDKAKDALKDGAPSTEQLDGVNTRRITVNRKDLPSLNTGVLLLAVEGTIELWISTDDRPLVRQMKVDGTSSGDPVTGTIKWSKFDETFDIKVPSTSHELSVPGIALVVR